MSTTSSEEWDDPPLHGRILATEFHHSRVESDEEFRKYTQCNLEAESASINDQLSKFPRGFHDRVRNGTTYTSFGEKGTTVSVNSYGRIMQISRYLGYGRSGFICADQTNLSEPWLVQQRMDELMNRSKDHESGIRLDLDGLVDIGGLQPSLEFAFDRWPRFVFHQKPTSESYGTSQQTDKVQRPLVSSPSQKQFDPPELSIQYFCYRGSVFQRHLYRRYKYKITEEELSKIRIDAEVCIRNLDYERDDSMFNLSNQERDFRRGPKDRSLIILHEIGPWEARQMGVSISPDVAASYPKAAALIITPFANGKAQKVTERGYISLNKKVKKKFIDEGNIDITLGYRLQLFEQKQKWENSLVPAAHLQRMGNTFSSSQSFRKIRFSEHDQFDFLVRRNLEHILSVCCIPIPNLPTLGNPEYDASSEDSRTAKSEPLPVAITCGDISGHFIGRRASLSIFQFLCSMLRFLQHERIPGQQSSDSPEVCKCRRSTEILATCEACRDNEYLKSLRRRIETVLHGHVRWICSAKPLVTEGTFSPNYWATGECIETWYYLPMPSLVDTPLQLLKIFWLYRFELEEDEDQGNQGVRIDQTDTSLHLSVLDLTDLLKERIVRWMRQLDESNSRGNYAFFQRFDEGWIARHDAQKPPEDQDIKFRLADHIMICLAVKCIERLGLSQEIAERLDVDCEKKPLYEQVRAKVLKRFTVEDPLSKKRMFATCRTPNESRILFHSKDTFLFHAMDMRFFQDVERPFDGDRPRTQSELEKKKKRNWRYKDARWKSTVDAQAYHDEYQYLEWEKPLWYAIAFLIGCQRIQINRSSIEETLKATANALLDQVSPNGLLPGRLGRYQEPLPFDDEVNRDSYWNATFETLHVLWTNGKEYFDTEGTREKARTTTKDVSLDAPDLSRAFLTTKLTDILAGSTATTRDAAKIGQLLTKTVTFDNTGSLTDQKSLVHIPDDWLQDWPGLPKFVFEPIIDTQSSAQSNDDRELHGSTIDSEPVIEASTRPVNVSSDSPQGNAAVIDVPKKVIGSASLEDYKGLHTLEKARTMRFAKKRIIWLPKADEETKRLCYNASPTPEKNSLSQFFNKHASHDQDLLDQATLALNKWETELHLSFFRLNEPKREENTMFLQNLTKRLQRVSFVEIAAGEKDLGKETVFLSQETISFRFVGDFFDRFWTCHFLDNYGEEPRERSAARFRTSQEDTPVTLSERLSRLIQTAEADGDQLEDHWKQRKVLELVLFDKMLEEIYVSTEDILEWVKDRVLQRPGLKVKRDLSRAGITVAQLSPSQPLVDGSSPLNSVAEAVLGVQLLRMANSENYSAISDNWRLFEQILQAIEDDLGGNIEIIAQWTRREEERGSENPRWTLRDEKRYRATITKMAVSNQRKVRDIERLKAKIKAFRESLPGRLESVRDDISFRGSENINLFTYVTVVFLPLGFATGIFSMSGAPKHSTVVSMVELALVALALTIFALANAKTTGTTVARPIIRMLRGINNIVLQPILLLTFYPILRLALQPVLLLAVSLWNNMIFLFYRHAAFPALNHLWPQNENFSKIFQNITNIGKRLDSALKADPIAMAMESYNQAKDLEILKEGHNEIEVIGRGQGNSGIAGGVMPLLKRRLTWRAKKGEDEERGPMSKPARSH